MLDSRIHSKSGVKPKELVVDRSFLLDALNLNWLGVIGGPQPTVKPLMMVFVQSLNFSY